MIALVGGDSLLGREVLEVGGQTSLGRKLRPVAGDEEEKGRLTEIGGEPAVVGQLDPDEIGDAAVLILAGSAASSKKALAAGPTGLVIDLTYAAEDEPGARVRAPLVESAEFEPERDGPQIVAHPAAIAIAAILKRLSETEQIARAVVLIFEPASERGKAGIEELQQQTVNLLSFQPVPKKVFDTQLSFALLAGLGPEAQPALQDVEDRIERHLASLLERMEGIPMPSLRLIQAPVFHGYSLSLWVEFEASPPIHEIEDDLSAEPFELRGESGEPPNNVGVAGQSGILVGALAPDRNCAEAIWLWAAVDNLRLVAENAIMISNEVL